MQRNNYVKAKRISAKKTMLSANSYQPNTLETYKQWLITLFLLSLMIMTRIDFLPLLQDTSWAVFFLIGFYLRSYSGLCLIILSTIAIDFIQIALRGGHQDFYLAPSYLFIIPAYATLWFAGRCFASHYNETLKGLLFFIITAFLGISACHLLSSGGYYWISMAFIDLKAKEFFLRVFEYYPLSLSINFAYLAIAAVVHLIWVKASLFRRPL